MIRILLAEDQAMLRGAQAVDAHFRDTDGRANLPLRAAFADRYYAQMRQCQTRAVFAYDERLALLPPYLQQLEMESNGKRVTSEGAPVAGPTAPVTWGGVGTDAQHAVFQLLQARITRLENTVRWSWQPGDVAVWDNRATQHYAVADFDQQYREVRRITVAGDVPVSIAGEHSRVIQGDATAFSNLDELIS